MTPTATCPACGRANASHRVTCLYCGAAMPNPTAPPPRERPVVDNLDKLVWEAMRGGSVDKLREALVNAPRAPEPARAPDAPPARTPPAAEARPSVAPRAPVAPPAPVPTVAPVPPVAPAPAVAPVPAPAPVPLPPPTDRALPLRSPYDLLVAAAEAARARHAVGDRAGAASALADLARLLPAAEAALPPAPALPADPAEAWDDAGTDPGPGVPLPPIRFAWALAVGGIADPARAEALAAALGVDVATARSLAALRHAAVALRGDDPAALTLRRDALLAAGFRATLVSRAELAASSPAVPALAAKDARTWTIGEGPLWSAADDLLAGEGVAPAGAPLGLTDVRAVVVGEIEQRTHRAASAQGRWLRSRYAADPGVAERRRVVVDLHTPDHIVRVVEGMTDLRAFGGEGSSRQALRRFVEALPTLWPGAPIEPRRSCPAAHATPTPEGPRVASGWPVWEEHTRVVRRLVVGG